MERSAEVLNIFIASSGNLTEERDTIEHVANAMNTNLASIHETVLITHRFEQLIGAAGNAQQQINIHADTSDLFIGILHRWWGSPTGNGFDSGFFEEFSRALARWRVGQRPRIALFFKDVDDESLRDPGDQLARVLKFRDGIREDHLAFYNRFRTADELGRLVTQMLATELADRAKSAALRNETGAVVDDPPEGSRSVPVEPINGQLADIFQTFSDVLGGRETLGSLDRDRLEFFSLALSADNDDLPIHLINRIFARRETISLWEGERQTWLKAYMQDAGRTGMRSKRVVPYLTVGGGIDGLRADLEVHSMDYLSSEDPSLRDGTARTLSALRLRPSSLWAVDASIPVDQAVLHNVWSRFNAGGSRELALEYWLRVGNEGDQSAAGALSQSPDEGVAQLGRVIHGLLARPPRITNLVTLMPTALQSAAIDDIFAGDAIAAVSTKRLVGLVARRYLGDDLRSRALKELIKRDRVPHEVLTDALSKRSPVATSREGWAARTNDLLFNRPPHPRFGDSISRHIEQRLAGGLAVEIDQNRLLTAVATLARHSQYYSDRLDDLVKITPFSYEVMAVKYLRHWGTRHLAVEAAEILTGDYGPVREYLHQLSGIADVATISFVEETFIIDALDYLASLKDLATRKITVDRLRAIAQDQKAMYNFRALERLGEVGTDDDLELLLSRGLYMTDRKRDDYMRAIARRLSITRLRRELNSENTELAEACLAELAARGRTISDSILGRLLRSQGDELRLTALGLLMRSATAPSPYELLNSYISGKGVHYYNVVVELDRLISGVPASPFESPG